MCLKSLTRVSVIYGCITNDPKTKWFRATKSYVTASVGRESKSGLTLVLAQGLLGGYNPDVGLGFPGAEGQICEMAPCDDCWQEGTAMGLGYGEKGFQAISSKPFLQSLSRASMGFSMGVSQSRGEQGKCRQLWEGRWNEFRLNHPEEHCYWVCLLGHKEVSFTRLRAQACARGLAIWWKGCQVRWKVLSSSDQSLTMTYVSTLPR